MALGLIWTIILRFQIQDISMEELSAKEALLLWCQRKTEGYKDVNVQNFHMSFQDGLAFCAIIHKHRPELIDFASLDKNDKEGNLNLAFDVAEKLGITRLLDAKDIVDVPKPDERSIITYVSLYYHYFNQNRQTDIAGRRIGKLVDFTEATERAMADYASRAGALKEWIENKTGDFQAPHFPNSLEAVQGKMTEFKTYKESEKMTKSDEKVSLEAFYNALQTKLAVNHRQPYVPPAGHSPSDIGALWATLEKSEHDYSLAMLAEFRRQKKIKDLLRRFNVKLQNLENWIAENTGALANADLGDSLAAVNARLKNHEAFEEETKAQNARHDALKAVRTQSNPAIACSRTCTFRSTPSCRRRTLASWHRWTHVWPPRTSTGPRSRQPPRRARRHCWRSRQSRRPSRTCCTTTPSARCSSECGPTTRRRCSRTPSP